MSDYESQFFLRHRTRTLYLQSSSGVGVVFLIWPCDVSSDPQEGQRYVISDVKSITRKSKKSSISSKRVLMEIYLMPLFTLVKALHNQSGRPQSTLLIGMFIRGLCWLLTHFPPRLQEWDYFRGLLISIMACYVWLHWHIFLFWEW